MKRDKDVIVKHLVSGTHPMGVSRFESYTGAYVQSQLHKRW